MKTFAIRAVITSTVEDTISAENDKEAKQKFDTNYRNHLYDDKKRGETTSAIEIKEV